MTDLTEIAREINIDDCYQEEIAEVNELKSFINANVLESIENIIDYLFKDEMQDWFCFENIDFHDKYYDTFYKCWGAEPMDPNISICRTAIAEVKKKELTKLSTHIFEDIFCLMDWKNNMLIAREKRLGV
jgi:hypothetical protein